MLNIENEQLDVKIYYEIARSAFEENDISQALKISKNGLKKAKSLQNDVWISKFKTLRSELHKTNDNSLHLTRKLFLRPI